MRNFGTSTWELHKFCVHNYIAKCNIIIIRKSDALVKIIICIFIFFFSRDESFSVAIIREIYDSENAHETFEYELEKALESECSLIIIEPSKLGDETSRWIAVGNCLHKTAALSGLAAIITGVLNLYKNCLHIITKINISYNACIYAFFQEYSGAIGRTSVGH